LAIPYAVVGFVGVSSWIGPEETADLVHASNANEVPAAAPEHFHDEVLMCGEPFQVRTAVVGEAVLPSHVNADIRRAKPLIYRGVSLEDINHIPACSPAAYRENLIAHRSQMTDDVPTYVTKPTSHHILHGRRPTRWCSESAVLQRQNVSWPAR
jgi:hypothetical protein